MYVGIRGCVCGWTWFWGTYDSVLNFGLIFKRTHWFHYFPTLFMCWILRSIMAKQSLHAHTHTQSCDLTHIARWLKRVALKSNWRSLEINVCFIQTSAVFYVVHPHIYLPLILKWQWWSMNNEVVLDERIKICSLRFLAAILCSFRRLYDSWPLSTFPLISDPFIIIPRSAFNSL